MSGNKTEKAESQFAKARRLLESELANGRAVAAADIMQMAEDEGISYKTFKRAKDVLGVISVKRGGQWYWVIPIDAEYTECQPEAGQEEQGGQLTVLVPLTV